MNAHNRNKLRQILLMVEMQQAMGLRVDPQVYTMLAELKTMLEAAK
jgi:hypothetical protein